MFRIFDGNEQILIIQVKRETMNYESEYIYLSLKYRSSEREQSHSQRPFENICFPIICQQRNRFYASLSFFFFFLRMPVFRRDFSRCHRKEIRAFSCLSRVCTHLSALYAEMRCDISYKIDIIVFIAENFSHDFFSNFDLVCEIFDNRQLMP